MAQWRQNLASSEISLPQYGHLCICIEFECTIEESQKILKLAGFGELYPKKVRDSIILFGITNKLFAAEINRILYEHGQVTL